MTLELVLDELTFDKMSPAKAKEIITEPGNMKSIRYFINRSSITKEPMKETELIKLNAIVGILQILYTSGVGSPISDEDYDVMQEMLVDEGIPRLEGSIEINDLTKENHRYIDLRGTLLKCYYLSNDEKRINPSQRYLSEVIRLMENRYQKNSGEKIDLSDVKILVTPKYDGISAVAEIDENGRVKWMTRGNTKDNLASNISHILCQFDDLYNGEKERGMQFEIMVSEENRDYINSVFPGVYYHNSRQIAASVLNSNEPDFKAEYLYPVPLYVMGPNDKFPRVHPEHTRKFPSMSCRISDIDRIREFSQKNKYVDMNGFRLRTDGCVLTIMDDHVREVLGRDKNTNMYQVAYKFTAEVAYSRIKDIEYDVSVFGYITPMAIIEPLIMKGNTVKRPSLSNIARMKELALRQGSTVKIIYDITPYITIDENCTLGNGKEFRFIRNCPRCGSELDLDVIEVQCQNPECPSRVVGRILNYCESVRIKNIGSATLEVLYQEGLLDKGIRSLYKLKKKTLHIEDLPGFGTLKTRKMISEIEAKRRLRDYELFGAIGIETLSSKTFQTIFNSIRYLDFIDLVKERKFDQLSMLLVNIKGIGAEKSKTLVDYLSDAAKRKELLKLLDELSLAETYGSGGNMKGTIVFTGHRPDDNLRTLIESKGWVLSDNYSSKTTYLVVPSKDFDSVKVTRAKNAGTTIVTVDELIDII